MVSTRVAGSGGDLRDSRIIASTVRNGRLVIFPGAGHLCLLKESGRAGQIEGGRFAR